MPNNQNEYLRVFFETTVQFLQSLQCGLFIIDIKKALCPDIKEFTRGRNHLSANYASKVFPKNLNWTNTSISTQGKNTFNVKNVKRVLTPKAT